MLAKVNSSAVICLDAVPIEVEVDIASQGLPGFTIVGLPDKVVEEAQEQDISETHIAENLQYQPRILTG